MKFGHEKLMFNYYWIFFQKMKFSLLKRTKPKQNANSVARSDFILPNVFLLAIAIKTIQNK